ncbi:MAG: SpoVG family protein [Tissierellia bacterium]|nr:SpoVG family protein [Tissierellia bacterium]
MEITDVKIIKIANDSRLKAVASVTFDDEIVIHDIKLIERIREISDSDQSKEGLFMAMPSKKVPNGRFVDIAHPINQEIRLKIEKAVFEKYKDNESYE